MGVPSTFQEAPRFNREGEVSPLPPLDPPMRPVVFSPPEWEISFQLSENYNVITLKIDIKNIDN